MDLVCAFPLGRKSDMLISNDGCAKQVLSWPLSHLPKMHKPSGLIKVPGFILIGVWTAHPRKANELHINIILSVELEV